MIGRGAVHAALASVVVCLCIAGCASGPKPAPDLHHDPEFARNLADLAHRAALAKPGARVCRLMSVGISERDWIGGVVVELGDSEVIIRIENAGRLLNTLDGRSIVPGVLVRDAPSRWTPCV